MSDPALRAAIDQAIQRHLATRVRAIAPPHSTPAAAPDHPSHARFALPTGSDDTGACVIEVDVACTHCGYCQSYGH